MQTLIELGLRVTRQRQAIVRLLEGNTTHPWAEAVLHQLRKRFPRVSFATVYNTLASAG